VRFEYLEPDTIESAVQLLDDYGNRAKILAGGTDLIVQMKARTSRPDFVIHVGLIEELKGITLHSEGGLWVGTLTTMRTIEKALLPAGLDILRQGAAQVSSPQIRNVATLGGNLCNGIPSADSVPALIALGSNAKVVSRKGTRSIPVEKFHTGPGRTVLDPDELLLGFEIPPPPPLTGGAYLKYTPRGTFELAIVGIAALLTANPKDLTCERARIVLGACGPTPIRATDTESVLTGQRIDDCVIEKAAQIAAGEAAPNPGVSVRAPASYRREMVAVWTRRAIRSAWERALAELPQ
jgi:CO/xanthine dehydrogenase FAD-binding subunit